MTKLTMKREQFAQMVANGMAYNAAYAASHNAEDMGQASIDVEASRLANHQEVAQRIGEIQAEIRDTVQISRADISKGIQISIAKLNAEGSATAINHAGKLYMDLAKLHGWIVDKAEVGHKNGITVIIDGPEAGL